MFSYLIKILLLHCSYACLNDGLNLNGVENCLLMQCDYSRSNYNQTIFKQPVNFQVNNYDVDNDLLNIALTKVEEPTGTFEYICSKHNNKFSCVRTLSYGSLIPKINTAAGIEITTKQHNLTHCSIYVYRYVHLSIGTIAAVANSIFTVDERL
jgi:hypothetical protein